MEDLINALACINEGKRYVSDALGLDLANRVALPSGSDLHDLLSERENGTSLRCLAEVQPK